MKWYTIIKRVPEGDGDYGTNSKTVFDGPADKTSVETRARAMAVAGPVQVFTGKAIGRLVWDSKEAGK